jgi:proton-translocating NADH-quinone oxidoreductase chain L
MSDLHPYLWLIPALPLAAAALIAFLGPRFLRGRSHLPCIAAGAVACVLSFFVLFAVRGLDKVPSAEEGERDALSHVAEGSGAPQKHEFVERYYQWVKVGEVDVGFTLRADGLTAIMLVTVTFIGTLIAVFATGYMHDDPGYPRFFAEVSLFLFAMTLLVLADNFVLLYAGWEGVGLCSYLLIGFWFQKPAAADAARKAFLVTRLGDMGLLLGIIMLWWLSGRQLDFNRVFEQLQRPDVNTWYVGIACLLIFCGCVGKSAQFPLHVWLPDAMEGPTPVSALIHAATMVTAGVYLVARCSPLFVRVPAVQLTVACIGCFTALLGAAIALTQNDLKRVLAYSTISQLGYMFLGLGSGAVTAGVFHLFTHAFFKALLFLAAGSVMHAMGGVIDMRRFSGLRKVLPTTHWTFLAGALALAGLPGLSGFWSKDEIIGGTLAAAQGGMPGHYGAGVYWVLLVVSIVTAFLTAFYTMRAYSLTFLGAERVPEEAGHHAHESPPSMTVPLMVLAVGAVAAGFLVQPLMELFHATTFTDFLAVHTAGVAVHEPPSVNWALMAITTAAAVGGIALGLWVYARRPDVAEDAVRSAPGLYQASLNKFFFDELYQRFLVKPLDGLAEFCRLFDFHVIDKIVDIVGMVPRLFGVLFRPVQNGLVQFYALAMILGLVVFLLALVSKL